MGHFIYPHGCCSGSFSSFRCRRRVAGIVRQNLEKITSCGRGLFEHGKDSNDTTTRIVWLSCAHLLVHAARTNYGFVWNNALHWDHPAHGGRCCDKFSTRSSSWRRTDADMPGRSACRNSSRTRGLFGERADRACAGNCAPGQHNLTVRRREV